MGRKNYSKLIHDQRTINNRKVKCSATTAKDFGFRLSGVRAYHPFTKSYVIRHSDFGNHLTETTLERAIDMFLNDGLRTRIEIISPLIKKLSDLHEALQKQSRFEFLASSILLIYEGDYQLIHEADALKVDARLIDFDHLIIKEDNSPLDDYSGIKYGVASLIQVLKNIQRSAHRTHSHADLNAIHLNQFEKRSEGRSIMIRVNSVGELSSKKHHPYETLATNPPPNENNDVLTQYQLQ